MTKINRNTCLLSICLPDLDELFANVQPDNLVAHRAQSQVSRSRRDFEDATAGRQLFPNPLCQRFEFLSLRVMRAYQVAIRPSIAIPLYAFVGLFMIVVD